MLQPNDADTIPSDKQSRKVCPSFLKIVDVPEQLTYVAAVLAQRRLKLIPSIVAVFARLSRCLAKKVTLRLVFVPEHDDLQITGFSFKIQ